MEMPGIPSLPRTLASERSEGAESCMAEMSCDVSAPAYASLLCKFNLKTLILLCRVRREVRVDKRALQQRYTPCGLCVGCMRVIMWVNREIWGA